METLPASNGISTASHQETQIENSVHKHATKHKKHTSTHTDQRRHHQKRTCTTTPNEKQKRYKQFPRKLQTNHRSKKKKEQECKTTNATIINYSVLGDTECEAEPATKVLPGKTPAARLSPPTWVSRDPTHSEIAVVHWSQPLLRCLAHGLQSSQFWPGRSGRDGRGGAS